MFAIPDCDWTISRSYYNLIVVRLIPRALGTGTIAAETGMAQNRAASFRKHNRSKAARLWLLAYIDARGISAGELIEGAARGSMEMLASCTQWADKVITV